VENIKHEIKVLNQFCAEEGDEEEKESWEKIKSIIYSKQSKVSKVDEAIRMYGKLLEEAKDNIYGFYNTEYLMIIIDKQHEAIRELKKKLEDNQ
jgi:tetratricopeptide (TPR) repeat protein